MKFTNSKTCNAVMSQMMFASQMIDHNGVAIGVAMGPTITTKTLMSIQQVQYDYIYIYTHFLINEVKNNLTRNVIVADKIATTDDITTSPKTSLQ